MDSRSRRRTVARWLAPAVLALCCALTAAPAGASTAPPSLAASEAALGTSNAFAPLTVPAPARAGHVRKSEPGIATAPSSTLPHWACPEEACMAIIDPPVRRVSGAHDRLGRPARFALPGNGPLLEGGGVNGGLDPADLQSAYAIPSTGGEDQTVALVDAYGYPEAEHDLGVYRERYGLPPCTAADGCFHKLNGKGEEGHYPAPNSGWESETSLDLDMVSAACPHCHIMLVEASSAEGEELAHGDTVAASHSATEISNSWGNGEEVCAKRNCEAEAVNFDHPGVMITVSGGDSGYNEQGIGYNAPQWPSVLPDVVAVGGTSLHRAENARGWTEEAWTKGGSGCSKRFAKPEWQTDPGCANRMATDVAAVGACETPLSVYRLGSWELVCGTSASSPLVAAIEAHATAYARSLPGAEAFYEEKGSLFDVTAGSNGACTPPNSQAYFCKAGPGYDGPTGNGSPDGPLRLTGNGVPIVTSRPASAVTAGEATLNGIVVANGLQASYHFEWGPTDSYGSSVPVPDGSAGSGETDVSQTVTGLAADATYHYRVVATSSAGTSYGADETFSAGAPAVTALSPAGGVDGGGTHVTITGRDLSGAGEVDFGSREAISYTVESPTRISAVSPGGTGPVDVTVRTPGGTSATVEADRFSYDKAGSVLAWGQNRGMLGDGESGSSEVPVEVNGVPEARAVAVGLTQSLALLGDGRVMGWGENTYGTVGDGNYDLQQVPAPVCAVGASECPDGPYLEGVTAIAAGGLQSLALLEDGTVVAWGGNLYGDLTGSSERSSIPIHVCTVDEDPCQPAHYLREVVAIAAGTTYSLALLRDGTLVSWGGNGSGQLGTGSGTGLETCGEGTSCSRTPVPVKGVSSVSAIAAGWGTPLALRSDGTVMSWGENPAGETGQASKALNTSVPALVCAVGERKSPCKHPLEHVAAVAGGRTDSFALLANGTVDSWGYNENGQLGAGVAKGPQTCKVTIDGFHEKLPCSRAPVPVQHLSEVTAIASGPAANDTIAQLSGGGILTWGAGGQGQLGDGLASASEAPVAVCQPYADGPCGEGPHLSGPAVAMAAGTTDLVALTPRPGAVVSSVQPGSGPAAGGTQVTVTGAGFGEAGAVRFGATAAASFEVRSPDEIVAVSPPGEGVADITVTTPEGTSLVGEEDRFVYLGPPSADTGKAGELGRETAVLSGGVDPDGEAVEECAFEYGPGTGYGSTVPCASLPAGSGTAPVAVSAAVNGLTAGTEYHFRLVARNAAGTSHGADRTFRTGQLPEAGTCTKLAAATGRYANSSCTTASAGEDTGRYEWSPLHSSVGFTGSSGAASFEEVRQVDRHGEPFEPAINCTSSTLTGSWSSSDSASVTITFEGCTANANFAGGKCATEGQPAGQVVIGPVSARLGYISGTEPAAIGWELNPGGQLAPLATPTCTGGFGPFPITIAGDAVALAGKPDKMATASSLKFSEQNGISSFSALQGYGAAEMQMGISGYLESQDAAMSASFALTDSSAIELRG